MREDRAAFAAGVVVQTERVAQGEGLGAILSDAGAYPLWADADGRLGDLLDRFFPRFVLIDVDSAGEWAAVIARAKLRPHTRAIPFHLYANELAGVPQPLPDVEACWAYPALRAALPQLVARALDPPIRYPDGWDAPLSEHARHGVAELNRGQYFEQHEFFELAWQEEPRAIREMYQGILQIGVAFLQIERGNWPGCIKMFRRGLPRLRGLPPRCQGVELAPFRATAEEIHIDVAMAGAAGLPHFDQSHFPRLTIG